jgi:hypothetical protein
MEGRRGAMFPFPIEVFPIQEDIYGLGADK